MEDFTILSNGAFNPNNHSNPQQYHQKDQMLAAESSQANQFSYGISSKSEVPAMRNDYSMFSNYIQQSAVLERSLDPALDNSCLGNICEDLKFPSDCTASNIALNEAPFKNISSSAVIEANTTLPQIRTCIASESSNSYSRIINSQAPSSFPNIMFHKDGALHSDALESKPLQSCNEAPESYLNFKSNSPNENPRADIFTQSGSIAANRRETAITDFTLYGNTNSSNLIKKNSGTSAQINYLNESVEAGLENVGSNPTSSLDGSSQSNMKDITLRRSTENKATRSTPPKSSSLNNEDVANSSPASGTVHKNITSSKMEAADENLSHNVSLQSSNCDSLSSDELIDLDNDCGTGYQDTASSHSQQSAGAGGGGGGGGGAACLGGGGPGSNGGISVAANASNSGVVLLNGVGQSHNGAGGGYMSLIPPTMGASSSSGHMGALSSGTSGSAGSTVEGGGGGNGTGSGIDFKHLFEELCPVCGDKVSGYHYGLLTCESCKGFFKRTVQNKKVYTCVAERSCHIDKTQRKRCPYCRFQKCLEVGMKLEAVRADRMRGGRNKFGPMYKRDRARKLQVMRQRQLALQALRTSIGSTDMKATPLSPGYQQAYPNMNIKQEIQIPQVSSLTQSPDSSPSPIAIALGQVTASTSVISNPINGNTASNSNNTSTTSDSINRSGASSCLDAGSGSIQTSADSKMCFESGTHPSSTADSVIEPLRVSPMIRDFVQSIDDREWQTQLFALLQKQTYNQVEVDLFELMCKVLDQNLFSQVDWARNTVFFKDLKVDDQMKLLQHSWSDMLVLDHLHQRIHNGLPDETQLNNGQVFNLLGLGLLGVPQLADYFNELQNKLQELKFDMGDYVCMKFLILLNPDVRGILNKKTVLEGHENVQAALLDYTLTCYPSVTDKFRRLLNILPDIHAMAARGEEHLYSKHCAGSAPTQTLLMEMLHAKRKV